MSDIVTQVDREAALSYLDHSDPRWYAIKTGRGENDPLVRAYVRHRIAAEAAAIERAASFVEQYPSPMNDLPMALAIRALATAIRALSPTTDQAHKE